MLAIVLFIGQKTGFAQAVIDEGYDSCNVVATDIEAQARPSAPCFNQEEIVAQDEAVWVRVHIHAFLDDNGEGDFLEWLSEPVEQQDLYTELDALVENANYILGNLHRNWTHEETFGIPPPTEDPVAPIRILIDGLTVHNNEAAWYRGKYVNSLGQEFGVDGDILNLFLSRGAGGNGWATIGGRNMSIESLSPVNFVHELGHLLSLDHVFELREDIEDTPYKRFPFDWNQDGDTRDYFPDGACRAKRSERNIGCWTIKDDPSEGYDYDGDCADDFLYAEVNHPCTSWIWQDNNIMGGGAYKSIHNAPAFTQGQISRMLEHLATQKCNFIEGIGNFCAPPSALVFQKANSTYCGISVYTGLTQNADRHRLRVESRDGMILYSSGWQDGPPRSYMSARQQVDRRQRPVPGRPFYDNTTYNVYLEAEGACGQVDEYMIPVHTNFECGLADEEVPLPVDLTMLNEGDDVDVFLTGGPSNVEYDIILTDDLSGVEVSRSHGQFDAEGNAAENLNNAAVELLNPYSVRVISSEGEGTTARDVKD